MMSKIFINNIGDLGEVQKASYYRFLFKGIYEELLLFPNPFFIKIKAPTRSQKKIITSRVFLHIDNLKLKGPNVSIDLALKRDLTYAIQLFIPGEYSYSFDDSLDFKKVGDYIQESLLPYNKKQARIKKINVKQDFFFGEIPLMTEEGTFIINGCERVVISQIIRSPGIYFRKDFITPRKISYTATIISDKGLWTKIILDEKRYSNGNFQDRIYLKLNDFKGKMGLFNYSKEDSDEEKLFLYDLLKSFHLNNKEIYDSLKFPKIFESQQLTRKIKKNGEPFSEKEKIKDEEEVTTLITKLFENPGSGCFSIGKIGRYKVNKKLNLDLPKTSTFLTGRDFLGIIDSLIELKYYNKISDDIDHLKNKQIRSIGELLQNQMRSGLFRLQKSLAEGFSISKSNYSQTEADNFSISQNWIIDPRPLTSSIKEFFKTSQLSQFLDQVNPLAELTHKRRISVFGPNGLKRDHISTAIRDIHPSQYGRLCPIETPEGQNAGLISSLSLLSRISSFGWIEAPYFLLKDLKYFPKAKGLYLNPHQESLTPVAFADIQLDIFGKSINPKQIIKEDYSIFLKKQEKTSLITTTPTQLISLATALIPFIEHDDANRALMGSNMQRQAVPLIYTQKAIVGTGLEPIVALDSGLVLKSYSEGVVQIATAKFITIVDINKQVVTYFLQKHQRSNQETSLNQKPIVWAGEKVFSGQILADGPSTNDGELSLGQNLTIAYMPWEGYNYEDAIVINERLVFNDCLTSLHIEFLETTLHYSNHGNEKLTRKVPNISEYALRHLDINGIVKIGSYVKENDVLIGKLTSCEEDTSPEAKLLKALYGQRRRAYKNTSLKVLSGTAGRVVDIRVLSGNMSAKEGEFFPTFSETIRIYIAQTRKIKIGDKLAGRHGNKGIISRILPQQDMPMLPDGTPVDIIFNPLGVPSRMNVGQIFECLLGFAGQKLGKRFKVSPFDEIYGAEASRVLINQKLKEAALKCNEPWVFNKVWPGKIMLQDGRTGEFFDNPVTVGKSYILKLVHLVEDKIHARSTGPYSMITEQPLAGKSQKGGQRFGEMEVWALEAYGCSNTLQELLTIKSDDIDGRNDMYESLIGYQKLEKPTPSMPEAFLALIRELHALGLDFAMINISNGFYSTSNALDRSKQLFQEFELRLKLRALLARKKAESIAKNNNSKNEDYLLIKNNDMVLQQLKNKKAL